MSDEQVTECEGRDLDSKWKARWQKLLRAAEERRKRDAEEGPDPGSTTETGLTVAE